MAVRVALISAAATAHISEAHRTGNDGISVDVVRPSREAIERAAEIYLEAAIRMETEKVVGAARMECDDSPRPLTGNGL
jgi:hypothetical protein